VQQAVGVATLIAAEAAGVEAVRVAVTATAAVNVQHAVGVATLVAAEAVVVEPVRVAVTATAAVAATAAALEVAVAVAGVGRLTAGVVVAVAVNGKATSAFPDKNIQHRLASVRVATSARPRTLARYAIGRAFWMARTRDRYIFVSR
jgi:hypothetical protein